MMLIDTQKILNHLTSAKYMAEKEHNEIRYPKWYEFKSKQWKKERLGYLNGVIDAYDISIMLIDRDIEEQVDEALNKVMGERIDKKIIDGLREQLLKELPNFDHGRIDDITQNLINVLMGGP